jgi:hypothetical protein
MYADAAEYEKGYHWRADADKDEGLYPREIFEGSGSAGQSRGAMAGFDEELYRSMAISRRSIAAFIGNMVGFGVDLAALRTIPFFSGLSSAGSRAAAAKIGSSILRGAVRDSVAFSLDVTEVELARALADERVSLGDVVDHLPAEILSSALIGGTSGALGGYIGARSGAGGPENTQFGAGPVPPPPPPILHCVRK